MQAAAQHVGQRHPDDGRGDQGLDEGREPQALRPQSEGRRGERDRVREREGRGHQHHGAQALRRAQRDHQTREKEQVVGAFKDVPNARLHEVPRRLVPARVEVHEARVAVQFVGALFAALGQIAQANCHTQTHAREVRLDGEARCRSSRRRRDGQLQLHVQPLLVPVELLGVRNARSSQMRQGLLVAVERTVGGERDAHLRDARPRQAAAVFEELDLVEQPHRHGLAQRRLGARQVDEAAGTQGHVNLAQRGHRHTHQQRELLRLWLDEDQQLDVAGDVVGERLASRRQQCRQGTQQRQAEHARGTMCAAPYAIAPCREALAQRGVGN